MMVSKTVSIDFEDLKKIESKIKENKTRNLSEYIQMAVKNKLKEDFE
ncbi:MAG TPA: hypothetical protein PLC38_03900 [Methanobacterium sp.]|jgi:Arc/MetJ-type ribon-helix-helix transcriptional regulator|nr:hypothetical protein [Methanobacterium sp.]